MSGHTLHGDGPEEAPLSALIPIHEPRGELLSREWVRAIDRAWRDGAQRVFFAAPRFESRSDFGSLVAHAVGRGLDTGWTSDGEALSDEVYVARLVDRARLRAVHLRAHVGDEEELAGTAALLARHDVAVTTTIELSTSPPRELSSAIERLGDARGSWNPRAGSTIDLQTLRDALHGRSLSLIGAPGCVGAQDPRGERLFLEVQAFDALEPLDSERVLPPACAGCRLDMLCSGVPASWLRVHGDGGLEPLRTDDSAGPWAPIPAGESSAFRPTERPRIDVAPRYPDTALITLMVPGCDLSCVFCDTPQEGMAIRFSTRDSVRASLASMAGRCSRVLFTGGEPSRLTWLPQILSDARELGYEHIQMQSHGGAAADPAVADAWIAAGLDAIDVPVYGADAEVHELVTRTPGSFDRTHQGLANLRARGASSVIHTTLFESNIGEIESIVRHIDDLAPDGAYIQITGEVGAPGTYAQVAPSPERVGRALVSAFASVTPETSFQISDLAPCLVPGLEELVASWAQERPSGAFPVVLPYSEWLMVFSGGRTKGHAPACERCALRSSCDGLPLEAIARFRGVGLVPR